MAGAALLQGQVQISWQVQHVRKVKCRFRGRGRTFARSSADVVAGAALSQGQVQISWQGAALSQGEVQISWQGQNVRKVKCRFRGRGSTFARSSADVVAGATFSEGQVQIS